MPTEDQLVQGLKAADAAGNTDDAQHFADQIKALRASTPAATTAASPAPTTDRSAEMLASGKKAGVERGMGPLGSLDASTSAVGDALFGVGNAINSGVDMLKSRIRGDKTPLTFHEASAYEKGVRTGLNKVQGGNFAAGEALGLVGGAGIGAPELKAGQTLLNGAKMIETGAAAGGVTAAANDQDIGTGALIGGALGAAGGALSKGAQAIYDGVIKSPALNALANIVKRAGETKAQTADRLATSFAQLHEATGKPPSVLDTVNHSEAKGIGKFAGRKLEGGDILATAEETNADANQSTLANQINRTTGGTKPVAAATVADLEAAKAKAMDKAMTPIGNVPVHLSEDEKNFFLTDVGEHLPRALRKKIAPGLDETSPNISLRDLETVRAQLGTKAKSPLGQGMGIDDIRDQVQALGASKVPAYGKAVEAFHQASAHIEGVQTGLKAANPSNPAEFVGEVANLRGRDTPAAQASAASGVPVGARSALTAKTTSPEKASALASDLAHNTGTAQTLAVVLPNDAARLQRTGAAVEQATTNLRTAAGAAGREAPQTASHDVATTAHAAAFATISNPKYATLRLVAQLAGGKWAPPGTAKKLAEMAVSKDPAMQGKFLDYLRSKGANESQIAGILGYAAGRSAAVKAAGSQ